MSRVNAGVAEGAWGISEAEKTASASEAREERLFLEEPVRNIAYYSAFALYCIVSFLNRTEFEGVLGIPMADFESMVQVIMLLLLLFKMVFQRAGALQWAIAVAVVAVGFVSWRQSAEGWLFWLALFVVCGDGIRLRPLAAISLFMTTCLFALTVACAQLGLVDNLISIRQGTVRHAMGFSHPNSFGIYLLMMCLSFSILRFGRNPAPDIALLAIAMLVNLTIADSRTVALLCAIQALLLIVFYVVRNKRAQRVLSFAFLGAVALIVVASFYFMLFYDASNPVQSELNSLLSGRLRLAHSYYEMGGITLFGNDYSSYEIIYWDSISGAKNFVVDNAYCHLTLRYGLIPSMLFFAGFILLLVRTIKDRRWDFLFFGLILMAVYGFSETLGIVIECNFFLVAMAPLVLYREKDVTAKETAISSRAAASGAKPATGPSKRRAYQPSGV